MTYFACVFEYLKSYSKYSNNFKIFIYIIIYFSFVMLQKRKMLKYFKKKLILIYFESELNIPMI